MKKVVLFFITVFTLISCSKDDDNELSYQLNKFNMEDQVYTLDNMSIRTNDFFQIGFDDYYCGPLEDTDLQRLIFYIKFNVISNDNLKISPFLTINLIIPKENLTDRQPLTIKFNTSQGPCNSSSVTYKEFIYNTVDNHEEKNAYTSIKGKIKITSIEQPFVKIKFEGELDNGKKFNGYYEGYLL